MDKAKSSSLSLPESYWIRLQQIADSEYGGNRTAAIREMIDAHEALSESEPISDLIARYAPLLKNRYNQALSSAQSTTVTYTDENVLLQNLLQQSISLVNQGSTAHFTALGSDQLKACILQGRHLEPGVELDHFVDKIIFEQKSASPAS